MIRVTRCLCGEMIPSNAPILDFIRFLWRHRKHKREIKP